MKKILLVISISLASVAAMAQNYENIRNYVALQQFEKAKEELDKAWSNAKFVSKAEAYILKTYVYASLAMDPKVKTTDRAIQLLEDGDAAYKKYKEMEPSLAKVTDEFYQSGPINLYSGYYSLGYIDYAAKKWEAGFAKMKKAVDYSDLLLDKKILPGPLDTNVLILAGITAENAGAKADAVKYYGRLADAKIGGADFESVYRFLVNYYFSKKDMPSFEKYKMLGSQLFPKSEFFSFDKVDFAVGLETNFPAKLKAVEEVLATDPNNFKANQVLGEIIYDTLNPREDNIPPPPNADELETKMVNAFTKAAAAKPGFENSFIYMGDHYINKAVRVDNERVAHATDMKTRTKPGQPNSKEDIAKRDALDKKYGETLEKAREPYENAVKIFQSKTEMAARDKQQYKKALSYLIDIAAFKKIQAKNKKSPDAAKYEAEEKKWNDLWESVK